MQIDAYHHPATGELEGTIRGNYHNDSRPCYFLFLCVHVSHQNVCMCQYVTSFSTVISANNLKPFQGGKNYVNCHSGYGVFGGLITLALPFTLC